MEAVEIIPPDGPINATVRPPGSKSITNRALPIAAVAKGTSTLTGVLKSDDTIYMIQALKQLGVEINDSRLSDIPEESVVIVHGCDGRFPATEADLFLGNSGTSIRFLTAMVAAAGRGTYRLDGIERMRERPIGDLVDALRQLGVEVDFEINDGFPPIVVRTGGLTGETVKMNGTMSSQFTSGLMMAAATRHGTPLLMKFDSPIVSLSYVEMTASCLAPFGVNSEADELHPGKRRIELIRIRSHEGHLKGCDFAIEPDASAASYWFACGTLSGSVTVPGITESSLQGDKRFFQVVTNCSTFDYHESAQFSATRATFKGGTFDFSDISDTAQTMAAVAVFADSPTTVTGVEHMRHKECDRVSAVVTELRKLGIECDEHQDGYTIYPGAPVCKEPIETYDDHRMAMSFALLGLKVPGIIIKDPDCVNKTYPRFWDDWAKVTGKPVRRFTL